MISGRSEASLVRSHHTMPSKRMTPEQRERKRARARERLALRTPEERERENAYQREWRRARVAAMTPEEREALRAQNRRWVAGLTPEHAERRREQMRYSSMKPDRIERKREKNRQWHAGTTPESRRARRLALKYGLTPVQWDAMFEAQGRRCACCGTDDPNSPQGWVVDHCHTTTKVRGILCPRCNVAVGMLRDMPAVALAAAAYLERHRVCDHVLCSTGPSGTCLLGSPS